jgi:hypothetical protein
MDDDFLLLVNSWKEPVEFVLPMVGRSPSWVTEIDTGATAEAAPHPAGGAIDAGGSVLVSDFSLLVLRANHQSAVPPSTP